MNINKQKQALRARRHRRVRARVSGTVSAPRLCVFRGLRTVYAQLIDDSKGVTLASAYSKELKDFKGTKTEEAMALGKLIAEKAKALKIEAVVFDRGGYLYHGRVKALADGAREGGLKF
ncbi:MAG TPA: 50S ribosomal protein L18 [bacterium]|nr:50S ribosomal protein L18 [bacterium]